MRRCFASMGRFLFGAADKIDDLMQQIPSLPPIVILRLRNMTAIDATAYAHWKNWRTA